MQHGHRDVGRPAAGGARHVATVDLGFANDFQVGNRRCGGVCGGQDQGRHALRRSENNFGTGHARRKSRHRDDDRFRQTISPLGQHIDRRTVSPAYQQRSPGISRHRDQAEIRLFLTDRQAIDQPGIAAQGTGSFADDDSISRIDRRFELVRGVAGARIKLGTIAVAQIVGRRQYFDLLLALIVSRDLLNDEQRIGRQTQPV